MKCHKSKSRVKTKVFIKKKYRFKQIHHTKSQQWTTKSCNITKCAHWSNKWKLSCNDKSFPRKVIIIGELGNGEVNRQTLKKTTILQSIILNDWYPTYQGLHEIERYNTFVSGTKQYDVSNWIDEIVLCIRS